MKSKLILAIIILIIIIGGVLIILLQKPIEQEKSNQKLNESQTIALLKRTTRDLNKSENLENYGFTDSAMIKFAVSYMISSGDADIVFMQDNSIAKVKTSKIYEIVEYIFGIKADVSKTELDYDDVYVKVPVNLTGGDAQIYKFKSKEFNEVEDTYIVRIDVLEVGASKFSELNENSVTEYDENDVIFTMLFKYKEQDGRRILLAYDVQQNW